MNRKIVFPAFCTTALFLSACGQLTWATGPGGKHPSRYYAKEPIRTYRPDHYQVISGKDKKGEFKYISKGSYPGLTSH